MAKKETTTSENLHYPPVVIVLGHVDHGKTSLLDAIRKTEIAQREHGGITQSIGASSISLIHDGVSRRITFIDTPGHEAFSKMRSRGAQAADIGLLVVSLVDGIMPQTKESIELLKFSQIPFIVVLTKADLLERNPEKVKQTLLKNDVLLEGLGGDVPYIEVSAKTGKNIKELLELILLVFDMQKPKEGLGKDSLKAIVIESKLDQKSGAKATTVVKSGSVSVRDDLLCEGVAARVRTLINDKGVFVKTATVGDAVELLGFSKVLPVGSIVTKAKDVVVTKVVKEASTEEVKSPSSVELFYSPNALAGSLPVVLCADTAGSLEAIVQAFPKKATVIAEKTGEITSADILLAKSAGAIVLGFNIKIKPEILELASLERVPLKQYKIIYELIAEVVDVLEGKALALEEKIYGRAKVLALFPYEKTFVVGVSVLEGRIAKGDKVRVMRGEAVVAETSITSVRQGKNQTSKVEKGQEAGILLSPFLDFTIGDMLLCHG